MMRMSPGTPRALVLAASLALVAAGRPALAQSTSEKAAQQAFDEGMKLLDQGKTADACPKLEESQRLDPAMGTQFRLAECWEKLRPPGAMTERPSPSPARRRWSRASRGYPSSWRRARACPA